MEELGWGYLDSGAVYRALGLAVERAGIAFDDEPAVTALALRLPLQFESRQDDDHQPTEYFFDPQPTVLVNLTQI